MNKEISPNPPRALSTSDQNLEAPTRRIDVSLVVPCFNERDKIVDTVERLDKYCREHLPNVAVEILVVDDGSTDGSSALLEDVAEETPSLRLWKFPTNLGRGAAIKTGLSEAAGAYCIVLDADLSYDERHVGEIWAAFRQNPRADVVVVSAYMRGGLVRGVPFHRLVLSRMANRLLTGFFSTPLSTVTCSVRGYRSEKLKDLPFFEEGKELHLEMLRKLEVTGASIVEIPGRLVWKLEKGQKRRKTSLKVVRSAGKHLLYGLLVRPTRLFRAVAMGLLLLGTYETVNIAFEVAKRFAWGPSGFLRSLWLALASAYADSSHSFLIATTALVLGFQFTSLLFVVKLLQLQQEETLKHVLGLYRHHERHHGSEH